MNSILPQQQRYLSIATLVGIAIVVLVMLYGCWNIQEDDAYIFYSYAKNIANGQGYVFNAGERVNATTSPLYTLLLALFYTVFRFLPFVTIPLLGHLIGLASLFLVCILLMKLFEFEKDFVFPFILPLVFLANPLLPQAVGMETFLTIMLVLVCLHFYVKERLLAASLTCSLAVLARPDALLFAFVLVFYHLIASRRLPSVRVILVFLCPIFIWLGFSWFYFGNVVPSTFSAKLAQTQVGLWGEGQIFFKGLWYYYFLRGGSLAAVVLIAALLFGCVLFFSKYKQWSILRHQVYVVIIVWNLVYLVVYGFILKAPGYFWYYTPLALGISLISTLPVEWFYRVLSNAGTVKNRVLLPAIYLVLLLTGLLVPIILCRVPFSPEYRTYRQAAEWLNANAEVNSSVGANDIGILRYYYQKGPVIDGVGLVNPDIAEHLKDHDYSWYIHHFRPDYLMFNYPTRSWDVNENMSEEEWFKEEYELKTVIRVQTRAVGIYERQYP